VSLDLPPLVGIGGRTHPELFRSDGIRFQPYKPQSGHAFPQRSVVSLLAVPDGGVGYLYGGSAKLRMGR
jgi:hypothetical protein